ncbi:M48 family metallopeptidase [Algiphilus aromaticivorans]|uniref:M48 family metallopeptidase n=1 Tax=Algiphilus aromaticivorans TaxID=382454 RepID=UPI0005C25D08|nr:M48 family metallopeptidase [Algiphilus aromaticivorans]
MPYLTLRLGLLLLPLLALAGCEQTPTGRKQLALVPDTVMNDMGERAFARMKREQALARKPAARALVGCVAERVVAAAARTYPAAPRPEDWEVVLFESPTPNAFALPGGRIGVHSGMLDVAESPAQLAAIVGHEVGHLLARHGNERMTQQLGIQVVLMLVGLLGDIESGQILQVLGLGAQIGIALPFSRAHEAEADLMGQRLMAAAGFPPEASVALWRNMAAAGGDQSMAFLSTHPSHAARIRDLNAALPASRRVFARAQPHDCAG